MIIAVKYRAAMILPEWKLRLHQYITGIVQNNNHKMVSVNSMPDHLHMFLGLRPVQSISELMKKVSGESSEWINKEKLTPHTFRWQGGYGAFSYSKSQIKSVCRYIESQDLHHRKYNFLQEYEMFLKAFEVEYDSRYIFKLPE